MKKLFIVGGICCVVILFYLCFVNYLERYQVGLARNMVTHEITLQNAGGYYITSPLVQVSRIDIRPVRVCITSHTRAFNCRLVQFEPSAYKKFIAVHGFGYYWWANRISFNFGYMEEYRGMKDILRGYSYGLEKYPFVIVLQEYTN